MPTAYTSLLGLALPVTGELQGTWGQTVNDAITSLLDTAVAGTTTLSTDADVTLTTTTGASNQARQAIILWTANGTTTRNITAPAQSKAYVVINASAGTQSIVIRGVGPTTGVTVAKGEKVLVAWNGSDFVRVAAYGGTGEFTTVDTTNLEVTNVKAKDGTSAATIADSTGVVTFTANPILNGGTANGVLYLNGSKVATSGSALTFDGTNAATTGTMSATKFIPTGGTATGNGLYLPAANTLALSTNGTERMRIDSAGRLVVGGTTVNNAAITTNASQVGFEVNSATSAGYQWYVSNGAANKKFWRADVDASTSSWTLATLSDAYTSYTARLSVAHSGGVNISAASTGVYAPSLYITTSTDGDVYRLAMGRSGYYISNIAVGKDSASANATASYLAFETTSASNVLAERMRIDSSGSVGIGMVPNSAQSTVQIFKAIGTTIDAALRISDNSSTSLLFGTTASAVASIWTNGALTFGTNSTTITERMRIDSSGNVGIGVTPNTSIAGYTTLQFGNTPIITSQTGMTIGGNVYYDGSWRYIASNFATAYTPNFVGTGVHAWFTSSSGTAGAAATLNERMRISNAGDVGIGTNAPASRVNIVGGALATGNYGVMIAADVTTGRLLSGGFANVNAIHTFLDSEAYEISAGSSSGWVSGIGIGARGYTGTGGDAVTLWTRSTERMRIDSAGNLGLGVTPSAWISDYKAIESSSGSLVSYLTNNLMMPANLYFDGTNWKYKNTGAASMFQQTTGKSIWYTVASGTGGTNATLSQSMELSAAGNLGIGITPSAWAGGLLAMQVSRGAISGNTAEVDITHNANYDSAWKYIGSTFATRYYQINGAHSWQNAASGTAGAALTWTERMVLDANGYLGVGVSPTVPLAPGSASPGIQTAGAVVGRPTMYLTGNLYYDSGWKYAASTSGALQVVNDSGVITWSTAPSGTAGAAATVTERMRIDANGNLNLGTTSSVAGSRLTAYTATGTFPTTGDSASDTLPVAVISGPSRTGLAVVGSAYSTTLVLQSNADSTAANTGASIGFQAKWSSSAYASAAQMASIFGGKENSNNADYAGYLSFATRPVGAAPLERMRIDSSGNVLVTGVGGLGYGTGSGGAVTQATSRTTGVTLDKTNGAITLVSAAGTTTWQSFTVTNNKVVATDTVIVNQKSGTDLYEIHVTAVAAGSFRISFKTTGGTTTEQPVFNFAVIKAVTA